MSLNWVSQQSDCVFNCGAFLLPQATVAALPVQKVWSMCVAQLSSMGHCSAQQCYATVEAEYWVQGKVGASLCLLSPPLGKLVCHQSHEQL